MSYNLLPASPLWQLKWCRKFDSKLTSTGRVICHLCRDPVSFSHWGNSHPMNLREILANYRFCREPSKRSKAVAWLYFPVADTEHKRRSLLIPMCDMRSRYCWGVGWGRRVVTCKCGRRGVGCGQSSLHFITEEMAPQKWAATSQLPHGGWQWSPRMNTSLIKANEAFFASSACAEKNNGAAPPPGSHSTHLECRERVEMAKKKGCKKIHLVSFTSHKKLNRRRPSTA